MQTARQTTCLEGSQPILACRSIGFAKQMAQISSISVLLKLLLARSALWTLLPMMLSVVFERVSEYSVNPWRSD